MLKALKLTITHCCSHLRGGSRAEVPRAVKYVVQVASEHKERAKVSNKDPNHWAVEEVIAF